MSGIHYRAGQFWRLLQAQPLPAEAWEEMTVLLAEGEVKLFARLSWGDQHHSFQVMRTLRAAGYDDRDLLAAALLHDVGKTRYPLSLWQRTLIVLSEALIPGRARRWSEGSMSGWRTPFVVKRQHAAWGAEMAMAAGSRPAVAALIWRHQDVVERPYQTHEDELLGFLQWADDQN